MLLFPGCFVQNHSGFLTLQDSSRLLPNNELLYECFLCLYGQKSWCWWFLCF